MALPLALTKSLTRLIQSRLVQHLRLLPHYLLYLLAPTYRHHSQVITSRDEILTELNLLRSRHHAQSKELADVKAQSKAELSDARREIEDLMEAETALRIKLAQETARAQEAMAHAARATASATEWESRYASAVADHIRSVKSTTNWFAQTTSARSPMFDGVGPTPNPPAVDSGLARQPGGLGRRHASTVAREQTQQTLQELEQSQYSLFANAVDELESQDAEDRSFDPKSAIQDLYAKVMTAGATGAGSSG
jgi:hypothetical protein